MKYRNTFYLSEKLVLLFYFNFSYKNQFFMTNYFLTYNKPYVGIHMWEIRLWYPEVFVTLNFKHE